MTFSYILWFYGIGGMVARWSERIFLQQKRSKIMNTSQVHISGSVYSRILWLFGLYTLLFNAVFLIGYYWLPEGFLRGSPVTTSGQVAAEAQTFWGQLGFTLPGLEVLSPCFVRRC